MLTREQASVEAPTPAGLDDVAPPAVLIERGRHRRVERVQDSWRVDDEWWRAPISRRYYQVVLDDGSLRTVYRDLADGRWYEQRY